MAIATTGGAGTYTKLGGTAVTLFTTPNTTNAIFIVDIVETQTATGATIPTTSRVYTLRVGPNTAIKISDDSINDIVCYSWVGLVIT